MKRKIGLEKKIVHAYFILLFLILSLRYSSIKTLPILFIYLSTLILISHVWWGAYISVKYIGGGSKLLLFWNAIMLIVLLGVPFIFENIAEWCLLLGVFFALAITGYFVVYKKVTKQSIKEYIKKKIIYEIIVPLLFLLFYVFFKLFNYYTAHLILSIITFLAQIFFAIVLFRIKKVYKLVKN